jgi:16S rRNA (guanine966-N2)-methyltransferase
LTTVSRRRLPAAKPASDTAAPPRIIGGTLGGRRLQFSGDPRTRPMKDRVREAIFNRLGGTVQGAHAIDLFAGTGALGLEAISRGAARATLVEQHFPTAELIRRSAAELGVSDRCTVVAADTFIWAARTLPLPLGEGRGEGVSRLPALGTAPWLVFASPPYALWIDRRDDMLALLSGLMAATPPGSTLVAEADERFDFDGLPDASNWLAHRYPPAQVAIWRKGQ